MASRIAIIGAGIVGTATGTVLQEKGFDITFCDTDNRVVEKLRLNGHKAFSPTEVDGSAIDIHFISVPTYVESMNDGLKHIRNSIQKIGKWIRERPEYTLVVVRSTVLPGTTEEIIIPLIERYSGKKAGSEFDVCHNPEYLREKTARNDFENPRIIVIGENSKRAGDILGKVYHWVKCPIHRVSVKEAEIQKFIHNAFNANKISFFNEMRILCDSLSINSDTVFNLVVKSAEASWNHIYGTKNLGPFSGMCLPKDCQALLKFSNHNLGLEASLLKSIIAVNNKIASKQEY